MSQSRYWALAARFIVNIGALLFLLFTGSAGAMEAAAARLTRFRWLRTIFFASLLFFYVLAVTLPVEVLCSYARYRHFGFADLPFLSWLQDYLIGWSITTAFAVAGVAVIVTLIRRSPRWWVPLAGLVYLALASLNAIATPTLIEPLTNTYTPLPPSETKAGLLEMTRAAGVDVSDVYASNASKQSRMLNAHVSGVFGTARISVDDTTLKGEYPPAIRAVVAHEIGHYVMGHVFKMVLFASLIATVGFAIIAWAAPLLIRRYGSQWRVFRLEDTAGVAVLWLLFTAWGLLADPITNAYARVQEAQADAYGLNLSRSPDGMAEFMIHDADIARLRPTALDVILFYDHPSDASRVEEAMRWRATHTAQ